jgi:predicted CXXCH cytochrome family protein
VGKEYKKAKEKHLALYKDERCGNCHAVHFSSQPELLLEKEMDLCLSCHGKDDTRKSKPLKNIKTEIEGKKCLHGPLAEGSCSACHQPHGSDYFRLLNGSYPVSFYAPYRQGTYAFCLSCHEPNLLRFPDTTIYTAFRNGKQNLHYLHVANRRKGRSCRACHQPHASNGVKLVNEEGAAFGDWKIALRLVLTPTGGSCAPGCHSRKSYDRKNPLDYHRGRGK